MNTILNKREKKLLWLAVGVVLLVNVFIIAEAFMNRSTTIAKLQLSERELRLPHNYGFSKEDSSARVNLQWTTPGIEPVDINMSQWRWLYHRQLQLADNHFDSFQFPGCEQKTRLGQKRSAWVLVEFNGQSYTEFVAQVEQYHAVIMALTPEKDTELSEKQITEKQKKADDVLAEAKTRSSRLFVIDAAANKELLEAALRNRKDTSGQVFIVPAELRAGYYRCEKNEKRTSEVIVDELAVESLYIPKHFAQTIPRNGNEERKAKYTIEISYGRFFEPWVSGFTRDGQ